MQLVLEWVYGRHCVLLHVKCWCPVPQPLVYPVLEIDGTDVTELRSARCTGDTITDVMDTIELPLGCLYWLTWLALHSSSLWVLVLLVLCP